MPWWASFCELKIREPQQINATGEAHMMGIDNGEYSDRLVSAITSVPHVDGYVPKVVNLQGSTGLRVLIMDIGATWLSCEVPIAGGFKEVILGSDNVQSYVNGKTYLGATIGRYANRIAGGRFQIGDHRIQLATNEKGNTLHGGPDGFHGKRWRVSKHRGNTAVFVLESPHGDQGFPGKVEAFVRYSVTDENAVVINYTATSDAVTPLNLTNHAHFNLSGAFSGVDVRSHRLQISADCYLPVNNAGVPEQGVQNVHGSAFDFRGERIIGSPHEMLDADYDHAFLLNAPSLVRPVARLGAPDGRLVMTVFTDKPAMQLYTGSGLQGTPNRSGTAYKAHAGVALETQFLPDSPNHPEWPQPSCLLGPEDRYHFTTEYRFESHD